MHNEKSIEDLAGRSYKSYRARLESEKRLRSTGRWWLAAQISLSTALVCVAVVFLAFPDRQSSGFSVALIIIAILGLVTSIVVASLDYSARAKAMFANYRALQAFSVRVETLKSETRAVSNRQLRALQAEYDSLLDTSENHTSADHAVAQGAKGRSSWIPRALPLAFVAVSVAMVVVAICATV